MAAPFLLTAIANAAGRTIYRRGGRFISRNQFVRHTRKAARVARSISRFASENASATVSAIARELMDEVGPPIGGGDWVSRVRMSTEKFSEMIDERSELG